MLGQKSSQPQDSADTKRSSENLTLLLVVAIVFPALFAWLGWEQGSLLARDFSIGANLENLRPATQYKLSGSCKSKIVLTWCTIKASETSGSQPKEISLDYTFFDVHSGTYYLDLLETRTNPPLLTTDLGQQNLWNRAATLIVLLLFGFCWPFVYYYKLKQRRLERQQGL